MTVTATWPIQKALATALKARTELTNLLAVSTKYPGIYSGIATQFAPFDYIVLGESTEGRYNYFMQPGHEGTETGHIWTDDLSKRDGQAIYAEVVNALDEVKLTLDGHRMLEGRVSYVTDFLDQDGKARHFVFRYAVLSLVGT